MQTATAFNDCMDATSNKEQANFSLLQTKVFGAFCWKSCQNHEEGELGENNDEKEETDNEEESEGEGEGSEEEGSENNQEESEQEGHEDENTEEEEEEETE
ncbi:hypothetical protein AAC387_Pa07g0610 [Persea americana]